MLVNPKILKFQIHLILFYMTDTSLLNNACKKKLCKKRHCIYGKKEDWFWIQKISKNNLKKYENFLFKLNILLQRSAHVITGNGGEKKFVLHANFFINFHFLTVNSAYICF